MKHPLYIGYLELQPATGKLQVSKPLDLVQLRPLLAELGDPQDGRPAWTPATPDPSSPGSQWLGRIGGEDLYLRNGYLICPWLGAGFNQRALVLAARLHVELACRIYEPGDGVFYTPKELALLADRLAETLQRRKSRNSTTAPKEKKGTRTVL